MNDTLVLIKIIVSIGFVLLLSILAEKFGPKLAGIISGVPTGTAIILFFFGLEQGPEFAAQSAVFNLAGMLSMQVLIFVYYLVSSKIKGKGILLSSIAGIFGYLCFAFILRQFAFTLFLAAVVAILSIVVFSFLFKGIVNTKIKNRVKLSKRVFLFRATVAALIILAVTESAQIVGAQWAGLLSAFPTTLFPLMLIVHFTYDKEHVHTIIKNVPKGQLAMVIYIISLFFTYPLIGVYLGTLVSYSLVIAYLVGYYVFSARLKNRK
jgi:uncharacterized membrane protein (GlpM family)